MSKAWPEPEGGWKSAWEVGDPLADEEIRELGYELQPNGRWVLVRPQSPSATPRPRLCRACSKFDAMFDGICAGCAYFGLGDPHGVNTERRPVRPDDVPDLFDKGAEKSPRERFRERMRARARGEQP